MCRSLSFLIHTIYIAEVGYVSLLRKTSTIKSNQIYFAQDNIDNILLNKQFLQ